jgi:hypothetical protein|eukprot:COSAG01_NODE_6600_length_3585_cov_155.033276_3_plen_64_part_00
MPTHVPPDAEKVEHVLHTFSGVQVQSDWLQTPSFDSFEQPMYGLHVSNETPLPVELVMLPIHE